MSHQCEDEGLPTVTARFHDIYSPLSRWLPVLLWKERRQSGHRPRHGV